MVDFDSVARLAVKGRMVAVGEDASRPPWHALSFGPLSVVAQAYGGIWKFLAASQRARQGSDALTKLWIAREVEGINLDLGGLAEVNESNFAIRHHGLGLEMAVHRYDHHQLLGGGDNATRGMDGELLHRSVDRRAKHLLVHLLFGIDQVLRKFGEFLLGVGEITKDVVARLVAAQGSTTETLNLIISR
jgi:hypothetical protein